MGLNFKEVKIKKNLIFYRPKVFNFFLSAIGQFWTQNIKIEIKHIFSGDNSIEEVFREELEDDLLQALDTPITQPLALKFLGRTILKGSQNECRKAHNLLIRHVVNNYRKDNEYSLRLLTNFYVDLPLIWARFGDEFVTDIIQKEGDRLSSR